MINLRYHIVSITAVFLALGIGLALGGTFLDRYTVDQLERNISSVEARIAEIRAENERLTSSVDSARERDRALVDSAVPGLFGELLTDVPVLVVAADGVDEGSLGALQRALTASGADFDGVLTLSDGLALEDADEAAELAEALGADEQDADEVRRFVVDELAAALGDRAGSAEASGSDAGTTTTTTALVPPDGQSGGEPGLSPTVTPERPGEPTVVSVLRERGLASLTPPEGGSEDAEILDQHGYRYVFVSGPEVALPDDVVLLPLLRGLVTDGGAPAVLASAAGGDDPEATREAVVGAVRGDEELSAAVSTVDDLESFDGLVATLFALEQLAGDIHGHYGVGEGATAPLPAP